MNISNPVGIVNHLYGVIFNRIAIYFMELLYKIVNKV